MGPGRQRQQQLAGLVGFEVVFAEILFAGAEVGVDLQGHGAVGVDRQPIRLEELKPDGGHTGARPFEDCL